MPAIKLSILTYFTVLGLFSEKMYELFSWVGEKEQGKGLDNPGSQEPESRSQNENIMTSAVLNFAMTSIQNLFLSYFLPSLVFLLRDNLRLYVSPRLLFFSVTTNRNYHSGKFSGFWILDSGFLFLK